MTCSMCCGTLFLLGQLGNLVHFRCRDCGMQCSVPASEVELVEDELE